MQPPRPGLRDTLKVFGAWLRALPRPYLFAGGAGGPAWPPPAPPPPPTPKTPPPFAPPCHIMEAAWTRWSTSEHRKVDCHSCHEQSVAESARQVIVFAVRRPERVGRHAVVPGGRCRACHTSGDPRRRPGAGAGG